LAAKLQTIEQMRAAPQQAAAMKAEIAITTRGPGAVFVA
jgi:hypothetical protein